MCQLIKEIELPSFSCVYLICKDIPDSLLPTTPRARIEDAKGKPSSSVLSTDVSG